MGKRSAKKNIITSLLLQIITILNGFIVPKIILLYFGSEVNGLISSISQFLNYINLLEGGVSGVIMASLYKPLANNHNEKVSGIIKATNLFFRKIGLIFIIYSLMVGILYPVLVHTPFSWGYVFVLTMILASSLYVQYFFSLTYRLLLNADRRGYIVSITQIIFVLLNLIFILVSVKCYPSIHAIKAVGVLAYSIQPIIYNWYINKNYNLNKKIDPDNDALSQRWSGFGQNLAFFIHSNTDVAVLTIFVSLTDVSVYSVYFMVIHSLRNLIMSIGSAISPSMGNILAGEDEEAKHHMFDLYEYGMGLITVFAFTCGALLIVPFVMVYTNEIHDANYRQPLFGVLLLAAEAIYCYRNPFVNVAYASGHFKETAIYAYMEAGLNIVISVIMVNKFGLVGVAVGTLISMSIRMICHVIYLKKNILYRPIKKFVSNILVFGGTIIVCCITLKFISFDIESYFTWLVYAVIVSLIMGVSLIVSSLLFRRELFKELIYKFIR